MFNLGNFNLVSDENQTLPNIHMLKMAHSGFSKGSFDKKGGPISTGPPMVSRLSIGCTFM